MPEHPTLVVHQLPIKIRKRIIRVFHFAVLSQSARLAQVSSRNLTNVVRPSLRHLLWFYAYLGLSSSIRSSAVGYALRLWLRFLSSELTASLFLHGTDWCQIVRILEYHWACCLSETDGWCLRVVDVGLRTLHLNAWAKCTLHMQPSES